MYALLPVAIRPRYAQTFLDLALGEDDKRFTDLDAGECGVDDGGVGIVADLPQQRCELPISLDAVHNGPAARHSDA